MGLLPGMTGVARPKFDVDAPVDVPGLLGSEDAPRGSGTIGLLAAVESCGFSGSLNFFEGSLEPSSSAFLLIPCASSGAGSDRRGLLGSESGESWVALLRLNESPARGSDHFDFFAGAVVDSASSSFLFDDDAVGGGDAGVCADLPATLLVFEDEEVTSFFAFTRGDDGADGGIGRSSPGC